MNPYAILAALVIWLASLVGVGYWQNQAGHTAERVAWQAKDNQTLAEANAKILELEQAARDKEARHAQELATIGTQLEQEKQDAKLKNDNLLAQYRAGAYSLRDPSATRSRSCASAAGQTATPADSSDGAPGRELSGPAAEFLLGLTSDANEVVNQLTACQAVVIADRKE